MSNLTIKRLYTENPFVDSLLFYSKLLVYNTVIKLEKEANNAETVESIKRSDLYIISYEGRGSYELYTYTENILKLSSVPAGKVVEWAANNSKIPASYHDELTKIAQQYCIDHYIEENNYYRMITGKPKINDYGIPIKNYDYLIPEGNDYGNVTYVHELSTSAAQMLDKYGVLDIIKTDYPAATYLNYIICGITIYKARKAYNYQILYQPPLNSNTTTDIGLLNIEEKFTNKYNNNRLIMIRTMYSDAMKLHSPYYDNFMAIIIMLMTMSDMLTEVQEHLIKKDILDIRCVQILFEQYGVPYYHNIPLTYQIKMVKQINILICYKSCTKGMLNLIDIFGAKDINIYRYFLLRDRKKDKWGDYIYNTSQLYSSIDNDIIETESYSVDITDNIIPFPFDYILEKGNALFVSLDGYRLTNGTDYEIYNYNHIKFLNDIDKDHKKIEYRFYYDKNTKNVEYIPDTTNAVQMVTETLTSTSNEIPFTPPYVDYFNDGNDVILSVGGILLGQSFYTINKDTNIITVDSSYDMDSRECVLIYLWGEKMKTVFNKVNVAAVTDNQFMFTIPEPFANYTVNGNGFFITIGTTYIDSRRYSITSNGKIIFDNIYLNIGKHVTFNFIYSLASIYTPINMVAKTIALVATEHYQREFSFDFPIENYIKYGYKIYVKLRGWYLDSSYYDIYKGKLVLRNQAVSLQPKEILYITFVYGPTNQNVIVSHSYKEVKEDGQTTFDISFPVDKYFEKGNKLIVDASGYLLNNGIEYHLSTDNSKVIIDNPDIIPYVTEKINYTFIYNMESEYAIKLKEEILTVDTDGQTTFYLNYPFFPYRQTTQGLLVFYKSLLVDPNLITYNKYNATIDIPDMKKGEQLEVLYIFNNKYLTNNLDILKVSETTVTTKDIMSNDSIIPVPVPFSDYLENEWPYFIETNKNLVSDSLYTIINNGMIFLKQSDIDSHPTLTFTFIYKNASPYVTITDSEDYTTDIDLKFVRTNLTTKDPINEIKSLKSFKSYDSVTLADRFWDGETDDENYHEQLKNIIKAREFNYARTKYYTIDYTVEITDMAFEIAYFYNMLYDDVFREDLLLISVPSINPNATFKLANLFIYMTALAYNFSGYVDKIMDTPTKVLYCKGFNFKANLNTLKEYIKDNRRLWTDYDVFGFLIPESQVPDMKTFVDIYKNNKNVYKTIVHGMKEAKNHDIYVIWKKMYDSLMVWQFNLEFFKLNDGTVAKSFSDFLKEKDSILYKSLEAIKSIEDKESREDTIVHTISDIVYILEEWLPSNEFKYIFNQFPGVSQEYILQYLFTMINFFKSYKIILNEMNIEMVADDPDENTIRFYYINHPLITLLKPDYSKFNDITKTSMKTKYIDKVGFVDKVVFDRFSRTDIACSIKVV